MAAASPLVPVRSLMELGGPLTLASPGTGFCELVRIPGAQICLSLFLSLPAVTHTPGDLVHTCYLFSHKQQTTQNVVVLCDKIS